MSDAKLIDMHCHLGFASDDAARTIAREAANEDARLLCCTVDVAEYMRMSSLLHDCSNVAVGVGMHPWWVGESSSSIEDLLDFVSQTRFIAEVGLDFGPRHSDTAQQQTDIFERICKQCAQEGNKVLSIHSVHATSQVLDILESSGVVQTCSCIFHWFSGSSDQLQRAIRLGCFFSVGQRMLDTKRGNEYARIIPTQQLLLETDMPEQTGECTWQDMRMLLCATSDRLESLRNQQLQHEIWCSSSGLVLDK